MKAAEPEQQKQEEKLVDKLIAEQAQQKVAIVTEVVQQKQTAAVNKNAPDNDAAGPVKMSTIAVVPIGFNAYSIAMKDTSFYPPKEIYKNQRVVDNARVLRQMNELSDRVHDEMRNHEYLK